MKTSQTPNQQPEKVPLRPKPNARNTSARNASGGTRTGGLVNIGGRLFSISSRTLLVKTLGMLGSDYDTEALNAARKVEELRKKLGLMWDDLIVEATQENNHKPGKKNQAQSQHSHSV
jgi:hypothetical protein